jgi:hypothetical protein
MFSVAPIPPNGRAFVVSAASHLVEPFQTFLIPEP